MRSIRYTVWVLCMTIVSVSLDAVPDPPAIQTRHGIDAQARPSGDQADPLLLLLKCDRAAALAWSDPRWHAIDRVNPVNFPDDSATVVWRFTDTSPPFLTVL